MYEIYDVIGGIVYVYGTAPTRYRARQLAKELGAKIRKIK